MATIGAQSAFSRRSLLLWGPAVVFPLWLAAVFAAAGEPARTLRWAADAEGGAPYVFRDPKDVNRYVGFEVDLAQGLELELGRRIEFVQYEFRSLVPGLLRGDFDFAMNGLEVTPDRVRAVRFTRPYYIYTLQLVARAGERRFHGLEECQATGGVVGTLEDTAASRLLAREHIASRLFTNQVEPYLDLELGRLDAVLLDLPIATYYARPNAKLEFVGEPLGEGEYAIAFRKDQESLAARFDAALGRLIAGGRLEKIYRKWRIWNAAQRRLAAAGPPGARGGSPGPAEGPDPASARGHGQETMPQHGVVPPSDGSAGGIPAEAGTTNADVLGESRRRWGVATYLPVLLEGAAVTVFLTFASMLLALAIGLPVALVRLYAPTPLRQLAVVYVEFFRGIPVLLLLFFLYYGLPAVAEYYRWPVRLNLAPLYAAVLGFGLNYAAYQAEIFRAGILSIPQGQWEAAASLGMSRLRCFRRIIAPQAVRVILPPMTNDLVALFKDTSVVSVIAVEELTKRYQELAKSSLKYLEIGLATAVLYLVMSVPLGYLSRQLERRWGKGK
jgi:polar amino acid transport system substrate-binding protein